jgi:Zn finger protein HypA/HybF involved in hydrogenase expression
MAIDFVDEPTPDDAWGSVPAAYSTMVKPPAPQDTEAQTVTEPHEIITVASESPDPAAPPPIPEDPEHAEFAAEPPPPPPPMDNMAALVQLFSPLLTPQQNTGFAQQLTLEQSARNLMTLLDERYQITLHDQAVNTSTSLAEIIAGILTLVGDRGGLAEFALNPEWREYIHRTEGGPNATGVATQTLQARCQHCQQMFKSLRSGQRYCCSPCGKRASGYREVGPDHALDCRTPAAQFHQKMLAKAVPPPQAA